MMNSEISLEGMEFHAGHGYYEFERVQKNYFSLDLRVRYDQEFSELGSDELEATVDYEKAYAIIQKVMSEPVKLLETLAHKILAGIQALYPEKHLTIEIKICKLQPPLPGRVDRSCVTYTYKTPTE